MKNKFNPPSISTINILLLAYLGVGLFLFAITILLNAYKIPFEYVSRNPESHFGIPIYAIRDKFIPFTRKIYWGTMS